MNRMISSVKGIVTIDVEPDNVWHNNRSRSLENLKRLPFFHFLCQEYGVRPTYLVTWSVASNTACVSVLESLLSYGDCEIGIHPHLWEIPPLQAKDDEKSAWIGTDYPFDILEAKLTNLTMLVKSRFGMPVSHRSGRWGLDPRQVDILSRVGIKIDSSVTPEIDWSITGAPNYTNAPHIPYQLSTESLIKHGSSSLLEVPCTVMPARWVRRLEKATYLRQIRKYLNLDYQWLRVLPSTSFTKLKKVCSWAYMNLPHINLMSHSSEFMAGGSPYWNTEEKVAQHFKMYRHIFSWWRDHKIEPQTLSEFLNYYQSTGYQE